MSSKNCNLLGNVVYVSGSQTVLCTRSAQGAYWSPDFWASSCRPNSLLALALSQAICVSKVDSRWFPTAHLLGNTDLHRIWVISIYPQGLRAICQEINPFLNRLDVRITQIPVFAVFDAIRNFKTIPGRGSKCKDHFSQALRLADVEAGPENNRDFPKILELGRAVWGLERLSPDS